MFYCFENKRRLHWEASIQDLAKCTLKEFASDICWNSYRRGLAGFYLHLYIFHKRTCKLFNVTGLLVTTEQQHSDFCLLANACTSSKCVLSVTNPEIKDMPKCMLLILNSAWIINIFCFSTAIWSNTQQLKRKLVCF